MMTFFIGWELWQEMTFVLACLIAIVFVISFVKLWRTNQILRRYELLDEEKRARLAEMQKYGIEIPAVHDIPFGSRAIQSGIEVDEIWISRPNTPSQSYRASCATIMDDNSADGTAPVRKAPSSIQNASDGSHGKVKASTHSSAGSSRILKRSALSDQRFSDSTTLNSAPTDSLIPESNSDTLRRSLNKTKAEPQRRWSSVQTACEAGSATAPSADSRTEPVPFGTAEVFANTHTRRTVSGFEILPAGSLGERVELHASMRHSEELPRSKEVPRTPNKLQKPRPKKQTKEAQE
ncbi:hypothetical protein NLG97_g6524 [Lecanicillium saksenae]|uniref:Uncharacterized protein n=1 Tax=Lecanicillium saksenae TaxID=468837 RepID=A0ACC1QSK3_9HYPO|nr:hypothetical protein NLG97_g6524 [Lecanicillium saksenae]